MKTALRTQVSSSGRRSLLGGIFLVLAVLLISPLVMNHQAAAADCEKYKCDDDDLDSEERQSCYTEQIACLQGAWRP